MRKAKLLIMVSAVLVFCFVPMINMSYEVIVERQVSEEYTTVEPYVVQEEVKEPYKSYIPYYEQEPYQSFEPAQTPIGVAPSYDPSNWEYVTKFRTVEKYMPVTEYRTVTKEVTKYREVTKTRLVYRPVVETRTKRVSILRYLLR